MDRPEVYQNGQGRPYDVLWGWREALYSGACLFADIVGQTGTVVSGLAATPTGPISLVVNIGIGRIYQLADVDATAYGSLSADTRVVMQQGSAAAGTVTLSTAGLTSGQSRWALVEAAFAQTDLIPSDDPSGGLLAFLNSDDPDGPPWSGPNNSNTTLPTRRAGQCVVSVVYGAIAATGAEVPPAASSGAVGLYLIDLAFGQTTVSSGQILVAGPSVGANVPNNYPVAPFLSGLLNSHHNGKAGQAPQVNLATEVQGILPKAMVGGLGTPSGTTTVSVSTTFTNSVNGGIIAYFEGASANGLFDIWVPAVGDSLQVENGSNFLLGVAAIDGAERFYGFVSAGAFLSEGGTLGTSFTLPAVGGTASLYCRQTGVWTVSYNSNSFDIAGSAAAAQTAAVASALSTALQKSANFSDLSNLGAALAALGFGTTTGVLKIPNELNPSAPFVLQWGTGSLPNSGAGGSSQSITWRQAFANQVAFVGALPTGVTGTPTTFAPSMATGASPTLTGSTFQGTIASGVFNSTVGYFWFAFGD